MLSVSIDRPAQVLHWRESNPPAATTDDYKLVQIVFAWRRVNKEQCVSQ